MFVYFMILARLPLSYASEPWYKGESKGLGYLSDRLLVLLGIHADVPGPR